MTVLVGVGAVFLGSVLVLLSRTFADNCFVPAPKNKRQSAFVIYMGFGDSSLARLYRWITMMVVGLASIAVGAGVLSGAIPVS